MACGRYLRRRGHTWFFHLRRPAALAACRISGEFSVSLRTGDYRCALYRARGLRLGLETLMTRLTPSTSKAETEAIVRQWIDACVWRQETHLAETGGIAFLEPDEIEQLGREDGAELDALLRFADRKHAGDEKARIARALGPVGPGLEAFAEVIDAAGRTMGVPVGRQTVDGRLRARTFLRGYSTLRDELRETLAAIPRQVQALVAKPALPDFDFLAYWAEFSASKKANKHWKGDTAAGADATPRLFRSLVGDLPIDKIDGGVAGQFRSEYLKLPFDYYYKRRWRNLAPNKVIEAVSALGDAEKRKLKLVSPVTANKHLVNIVEYWEYLVRNAKIPRGLDNPFRGHLTTRRRGRAARDEHPMWPADLDRALFVSPLYNGCQSIYRRGKPGKEIHRDALFWVTMIGRTTGARENEICGRLVGDIDFIDTAIGRVAYLKIRNSKTPSSSRDIPFPELVLDAGFLEYRYYGRAPDEPLFPELIAQGAEPRRSAPFSGRFTEYRKKIGVYREGIDFRAFRGNVETELRNLEGVPAGWIDELIGHDSPIRRSEGARYTKGILMANLKRTIDRIRIGVDPYNPTQSGGAVEFSHLAYDGPRGVPAPGAVEEIKHYVALAEREMRKKAPRRRN